MIQNKIQLVVFLGILSKASCAPFQFILIEEPKTWGEAQSYCREKHTDLATVQSDEDRAKLKEAANAVNFQSVAWSGFYKVVWRWSYQNTMISYARWDFSEPNSLHTSEVCAFVKRNGRWGDTYCYEQRYVFCLTGLVPIHCHYLTDRLHRFELKIFVCVLLKKQSHLHRGCPGDSYHPDFKFRYIEIGMNWHEAQTYCRANYKDLATVGDDTENQVLVDQLTMHYEWSGWIGLSKTVGQWLWLDQTSVSPSVKWLNGQPDDSSGEEECATANIDGELADDNCTTPLPFYCRENGKIQRVRVAVKSDGHLDESAVMEAIEKKMKEILSDQDAIFRSSITWSVQPDGNIFQQQKTQENTQKTACEESDPVKD